MGCGCAACRLPLARCGAAARLGLRLLRLVSCSRAAPSQSRSCAGAGSWCSFRPQCCRTRSLRPLPGACGVPSTPRALLLVGLGNTQCSVVHLTHPHTRTHSYTRTHVRTHTHTRARMHAHTHSTSTPPAVAAAAAAHHLCGVTWMRGCGCSSCCICPQTSGSGTCKRGLLSYVDLVVRKTLGPRFTREFNTRTRQGEVWREGVQLTEAAASQNTSSLFPWLALPSFSGKPPALS